MIKFFSSFLTLLIPLTAIGQGVHFGTDVSVRNRQLGHYHKMVSWDDSQYKEFAYYETSQYGAIMDFMNWRAIFPPGYDKNDTDKKYPTIVMLHGAGESGRKWTGRFQYEPTDPRYDNNGHHLLHGGQAHLQAVNRDPSHSRAFPGIVIFPQVSYNGVWTGDNTLMAAKIIEHMIEEYNVDPYKIAVHGLSNGAKGVWHFATERPDLFAAGLPMSGVGTDRDAMTDSLVTMPLWIFQGGTDTNPSPSWSQQWYDVLQQKGGKPRYTLYDHLGHGTWNAAYAEPDFFSWILSHDKREIFYFAESIYEPTPANPLKLGFSAGFLAYQWTRNGADIPGATGRYYNATQGGVYTVKFKQRINNQWAESFELDLGGAGPCTDCPTEEVVHIPDANFKAVLLADAAINTNGDEEIQVSEAEAVTDLHLNGNNIADLTGIEAFTAIGYLHVSDNNLSVLDLSSNTGLNEIFAANNDLESVMLPDSYIIRLELQNNMLTSLDVSPYTNLENLNVSGNQLTTLDLSHTITLYSLNASNNELVSLNVQNGHNHEMYGFDATGNADLECVQVDNVANAEANWSDDVDAGVVFSTDCSGSTGDPVVFIPDANFKAVLVANASVNTNGDGEIQVAEAEAYSGSLNVMGNNIADLTGIEAFTVLTDLRVQYNDLTTIDVSSNTLLKELHVQNNQLTAIDLSANTELVKLRIMNNGLTALDVSFNSKMRYLEATNNALESLNVQNGNNRFMYTFRATGNPALTCVQVDDVAAAEADWTDEVDPGVSFSLDCGGGSPEPVVYIPDANFKAVLLANTSINTNEDDEIQVSEAEAVNDIHLSGNSIADLTGIEAFTALNYLDVTNNSLSTLDLSSNTVLNEVFAANNDLENVTLPASYIIGLDFRNNMLTSLDVSDYYYLENLNVSGNQLTSLDLSSNGTLYSLDASNNELVSLNVQNGHNHEMYGFDATGNPDLECVQVDNVADAEAYWSDDVDSGVTFSTDCSGGTGGDPVVFIPDANFKAALVADGSVNTNGDGEIQVAEAEAYGGQLNLIGQGISDLTGIEAFTALTDLRVHYNNLSSVDLSANTQLKELHLQNNQLAGIDLSSNTALVKIRLQNNALASLDVSGNSVLRYLEVQNNSLSSLNVRNGNNHLMYSFNALGNPGLSCVEVDNVADAEANWSTRVDPGVSFSTDCGGGARFAATSAGTSDGGASTLSSAFGEPMAYPNPFRTSVSISLPEGTPVNQPMIVYDYLGRLIKTAGHTSTAQSVMIDLSDVRGGLYILRIGNHSLRLKKED